MELPQKLFVLYRGDNSPMFVKLPELVEDRFLLVFSEMKLLALAIVHFQMDDYQVKLVTNQQVFLESLYESSVRVMYNVKIEDNTTKWVELFPNLHFLCQQAVGHRVTFEGTNGNEYDKEHHGEPIKGEGQCIEYHDSHGLCIIVILDDGTRLCVDPTNIIKIKTNLKLWPAGKVALISGRVSDPLCEEVAGHKVQPCWNCGQDIRVGPQHQHFLAECPHSYEAICIQCFSRYETLAKHNGDEVLIIRPQNPERNQSFCISLLLLFFLSFGIPREQLWLMQISPDQEFVNRVVEIAEMKIFLRKLLSDFGEFSQRDIATLESAIIQGDSIDDFRKKFITKGEFQEIEFIGYHTNKLDRGSYEEFWNTIVYSFKHYDDRLLSMKPVKVTHKKKN